jgi:hypothetical protein
VQGYRLGASLSRERTGACTLVQAFSRPVPRAMLRSGRGVSRVTSRGKSWHDVGVHNPAFDSQKSVLLFYATMPFLTSRWCSRCGDGLRLMAH